MRRLAVLRGPDSGDHALEHGFVLDLAHQRLHVLGEPAAGIELLADRRIGMILAQALGDPLDVLGLGGFGAREASTIF